MQLQMATLVSATSVAWAVGKSMSVTSGLNSPPSNSYNCCISDYQRLVNNEPILMPFQQTPPYPHPQSALLSHQLDYLSHRYLR